MEARMLGRTGRRVGVIGLGAWQLGADWGRLEESEALGTLHSALESGVDFVDTADEYGDGRSEQIIGEFLRWCARTGARKPTVATKMGRRLPQEPENYNAANFRAWTDRSRRNLGVERLDLVQLHCPPDPVYACDEVFDALDALVADQAIAAYGVSVRTCEQALAAIARPGLATVQIVLNAFRMKPLERVLPAAARAGVGVIARVPLASGLLSGRYTAATVFGADDHRSYNRHGEVFDAGETFSGVDFTTGLEAVERLRPLVPQGTSLAQFALRWIIDQEAVSVVIPGARNARQAHGNAAAAALAPLDQDTHRAVQEVYDQLIRPQIHHRW
ncbi:aldo/keto reductase [Actinomadura sp. NPDC000600]|uniref:aldo/keto reductase n=1 Tax=Actinomadura sp. NPDC000600 TaxID=3154262 RepID=UPI00339109E6